MDQKHPETRYWHRLLPAFLGIILVVQACSAYNLHLDPSVSPQNVFIGNAVTSYFHVYDSDHPGVPITGSSVLIIVTRIPSIPVHDVAVPINASGWAAYTFTPPETGSYSITSRVSVNYSKIAGLPAVGVQNAYGNNMFLNVTSMSKIPFNTIAPIVIVTTTPTVQPVTTTVTEQPTTTVTQVTQVTPVTQVTQVTSVPPVSSADSTPPATTLTLAGTDDGSGGYSSDVTCTLAAADNAGGSGVSVTQYSFDGTTWYTYTKPVSIIKTGVTTLYYRSADNAGSTEVAKVKAIMISGPGAAPAGTTVPGTGSADTTPAVSSTAAGAGSPLPLWLIVLVILVILAAIGGALYLKSRQGKEEPKK